MWLGSKILSNFCEQPVESDILPKSESPGHNRNSKDDCRASSHPTDTPTEDSKTNYEDMEQIQQNAWRLHKRIEALQISSVNEITHGIIKSLLDLSAVLAGQPPSHQIATTDHQIMDSNISPVTQMEECARKLRAATTILGGITPTAHFILQDQEQAQRHHIEYLKHIKSCRFEPLEGKSAHFLRGTGNEMQMVEENAGEFKDEISQSENSTQAIRDPAEMHCWEILDRVDSSPPVKGVEGDDVMVESKDLVASRVLEWETSLLPVPPSSDGYPEANPIVLTESKPTPDCESTSKLSDLSPSESEYIDEEL